MSGLIAWKVLGKKQFFLAQSFWPNLCLTFASAIGGPCATGSQVPIILLRCYLHLCCAIKSFPFVLNSAFPRQIISVSFEV